MNLNQLLQLWEKICEENRSHQNVGAILIYPRFEVSTAGSQRAQRVLVPLESLLPSADDLSSLPQAS